MIEIEHAQPEPLDDDYTLPAALAAELNAVKCDLVLAVMNNPDPLAQLRAVKTSAKRMAVPTRHSGVHFQIIMDRLFEQAENSGIVAELGELTIATAIEKGLHDFEPEPTNGHAVELDPPPPNGLEDYGLVAGGITEPEQTPAAPFISPPSWPKEPPPRVSWVAHNLIPRGDVSSLGGDGGSGKTMLALQLATAMARGAPDWLGAVVEPAPVVFLSGEEPEDEIRRRVDRIAARQGFDCDDLADLHFWFPTDVAGCTFATPGPGGVMQATPLFRSIEAAVCAMRPGLVVLDNVAAVFAGNQNDRVMVRTFVNLWRGMARAAGCGVLLLDHPSLSGMQNGTGRGGNMDWRNSVRAALHLKAAEDKADADRGVRVLEHLKSNYAPLQPAQRLEWIDGVLSIEGTASPHQRAAQNAQADEKFIEHLETRNRLGRDVSDKAGRNYAPKIFEEMEGDGGYTKRKFAEAMERLFIGGKIELEPIGPPSDNKKRIVRLIGSAQ
jgi:RecA-family ATPase